MDATVYSVAFGPDSLRLAAGCSAGRSNQPAGVAVWDARPLDDTLRAEAITRHAIAEAAAKGDSLDKARETIRRLVAINARIKALALEQIGRKWSDGIRRYARQVVTRHYKRLLLAEEVHAAVNGDESLTEAVRKIALELAKDGEDPSQLNDQSWTIVSQPGQTTERYELALRYAETACRLAPENHLYLNTLGVAQYRAAKYAEAVETLTRSEELDSEITLLEERNRSRRIHWCQPSRSIG